MPIRIIREPFSLGAKLIVYETINGKPTRALVGKFEWVPIEEMQTPKATLEIHYEDLQELMDALKEQNIKPKDQSLAEGKLEATKYHLEDMRTLLHLNAPAQETVPTVKPE